MENGRSEQASDQVNEWKRTREKEKYLKMQHTHSFCWIDNQVQFGFSEFLCFIYTRFFLNSFFVLCSITKFYAVNWSVCSWELMRKMLTMNFLTVEHFYESAHIERVSERAKNENSGKSEALLRMLSYARLFIYVRFISLLHAFDICGCTMNMGFHKIPLVHTVHNETCRFFAWSFFSRFKFVVQWNGKRFFSFLYWRESTLKHIYDL